MAFYKLEIYLPHTHLEQVCQALWQQDAGHIGRYDHCFCITETTGFWRPLPGAEPYNGQVGQLCSVPEYKLEVTCTGEQLAKTLQNVKQAHPYEEPVIYVTELFATGLTDPKKLPE